MKIVLATTNPGKLKEFQQCMRGLPYEFVSQAEFNVTSPVEDGLTFIENALIKARHVARVTKLPALADDSGLCVPALLGEPGIYSARYGGEGITAEQRYKKLLQAMEPHQHREAFFYCAIVYVAHEKDPTPIVATAAWSGEILRQPQGSAGFGYDPIFYVPTHGCSAAELDAAEKNRISHRGQAIARWLNEMEKVYASKK